MTKRNSIGICDLLALLFIALKLMGYIDWSWIWVLSPIWIAVCLYLFCGIAIKLLEKMEDNKNKDNPEYWARKAAKLQMREIIKQSEEQRKMFE